MMDDSEKCHVAENSCGNNAARFISLFLPDFLSSQHHHHHARTHGLRVILFVDGVVGGNVGRFLTNIPAAVIAAAAQGKQRRRRVSVT